MKPLRLILSLQFPMLFRSSRVAIIGDPMQLRPISALTQKQDLKIKTGFKLEQLDELLLSEHSLDAAAAHNPPLLLAEHYRCPPPLAHMLSELFYDGKLKIKSPPANSDSFKFIEQLGSWSRTAQGIINHREAQTITELIQSHPEWITEGLGVVTLQSSSSFIKQRLSNTIQDHKNTDRHSTPFSRRRTSEHDCILNPV